MDELSVKGKEHYYKFLPSILPHYKDQFIVIDITGEYWIDPVLTTALHQARTKFPEKRFFIAKIGASEGAIAHFS